MFISHCFVRKKKDKYAGHFRKCLTLVSGFFQILKADTRWMGRFSDVVRGL